MKFSFITIFPELIEPYFNGSIMGRARQNGLFELDFINPRDFSFNRHKKVDEYMLGGGAGLLMMADPLFGAIKSAQPAHTIFLSPVGKKFSQNDAKRLAQKSHIALVCGRYEGFDERAIELCANEVFSLGDFVISGGELAAMMLADAVARNINGVLGNTQSLVGESFAEGLLEAPNFTKPDVFKKNSAISAFLKGNHAKICALKNLMALCKTRFFRPDLYQKLPTNLKESR